jgi:hypothetical protein
MPRVPWLFARWTRTRERSAAPRLGGVAVNVHLRSMRIIIFSTITKQTQISQCVVIREDFFKKIGKCMGDET